MDKPRTSPVPLCEGGYWYGAVKWCGLPEVHRLDVHLDTCIHLLATYIPGR